MTHSSNDVNTAPQRYLSDTDKLIQAGLISANVKPLADRLIGTSDGVTATADNHFIDTENNTPWFLQIFLGASGFFAGIAIIAFIALLMLSALDDTSVQVIVGLVLLGISFALFRAIQQSGNTFAGSLAFAFSVAGQVFITIALFDNDFSNTTSVVMLMLFQIIMAVVVANLAHRMLNFMVALGCMVWLLSYFDASELSAGLLALLLCIFNLQRYEWLQVLNINSVTHRTLSLQICRAMGYACSLMLLGISVYEIISAYRYGLVGYGYYHYSLAQFILILASGYGAYLMLRRYGMPLRSQVGITTLLAIAVLGGLSVFVSGLLASSLVIVIAMANRQRILMALGIIALVSYVFWYYYQLDTTLIVKSISMLVVGIALLITRWLLGRVMPTPTQSMLTRTTSEGIKS